MVVAANHRVEIEAGELLLEWPKNVRAWSRRPLSMRIGLESKRTGGSRRRARYDR